MALVFVITTISILLYLSISNKENKKQYLMTLLTYTLSFLVLYLLFKLTIFKGMGNSYDQQSLDILKEDGRFIYMIYGFIYFLINVLFAIGFMPIITPAFNFKSLDHKEKIYYLYLMMLLVLSAGVVAYTITVREDFYRDMPIAHVRYICYVYIPLLVLFIKYFDKDVYKLNKYHYLAFAILVFVVLALYKGVPNDSYQESPDLNYLNKFPFLRYVILLLVIYMFISFTNNKQKMICLFFVGLIGIQLFDNVMQIHRYRKVYTVTAEELIEINNVSNFINDNDGENFLIITNNQYDHIDKIADTYFDIENVYTTSTDLLSKMETNELSKNKVRSKYYTNDYGYYDLDNINYIIYRKDMNIELDDSCVLINITQEGYFDICTVLDTNKVPEIFMGD